jgi:hypothetical protein
MYIEDIGERSLPFSSSVERIIGDVNRQSRNTSTIIVAKPTCAVFLSVLYQYVNFVLRKCNAGKQDLRAGWHPTHPLAHILCDGINSIIAHFLSEYALANYEYHCQI